MHTVGLCLDVSEPAALKNTQQLAFVDEFMRKEIWQRDGILGSAEYQLRMTPETDEVYEPTRRSKRKQ